MKREKHYMTAELKQKIKDHLSTLEGCNYCKAVGTGIKFGYSSNTINLIIKEGDKSVKRSRYLSDSERAEILRLYPLCEGKSELSKYNSIAVNVKRSYASIRNIILASK